MATLTDHAPCRRCGSMRWYVFTDGRVRCADCVSTRRPVVSTDDERRKRREAHTRWRRNNAAHVLEYSRAQKLKTRLADRARYHGLSLEQLTALRDAQSDKCAACAEPLDFEGSRGFYIDHDHRCCDDRGSCGDCVRGLLCLLCNRLAVSDDWRISAVLGYLQRGGWTTSRP